MEGVVRPATAAPADAGPVAAARSGDAGTTAARASGSRGGARSAQIAGDRSPRAADGKAEARDQHDTHTITEALFAFFHERTSNEMQRVELCFSINQVPLVLQGGPEKKPGDPAAPAGPRR